ncbi:hypothetical protein DFP72DRAFT_862120 [Ephemerocybe angulata]|uniref:Uncharacterized protein n=1 Tax=Ephemerocybe angulata TaxID=980116 RepID=A0A8H6LRW8_9AGAR|nr:hypothetical protein DFP72DRAFT_862120 [Tulosesus angulatus]
MSSSLGYGDFFEGCDEPSATTVTDCFSESDSVSCSTDPFWEGVKLSAGGSASNATDEITEPELSVSEDEARTSKPVANEGRDRDDDISRHSGAFENRSASRKRRSARLSDEGLTPDVAEDVPKEGTSETRPLFPKKVKKIIAKPAVWVDPFNNSDPKMRRDYIAYCTTCELWLGDESDPDIRRKYNEHRRTPVHINKYKDAMSWDYTKPLGCAGPRVIHNLARQKAGTKTGLCYLRHRGPGATLNSPLLQEHKMFSAGLSELRIYRGRIRPTNLGILRATVHAYSITLLKAVGELVQELADGRL